jgi:hypothetical protein
MWITRCRKHHFLKGFCDVLKVVIIQNKKIVKFGYILNLKVEKKQKFSIFLTTGWNLS